MSPLVVSKKDPEKFANFKQSDGLDVNDYIAIFNNATEQHSSMFGETWSINLQRALLANDKLSDALSQVTLAQDYPEVEESQNYIDSAKMLASLVLTHEERKVDRDILFVSFSD